MRIKVSEWAQSYYCFENGDGTRYTVHLCACEQGGTYVLVNDSSAWLWFDNDDIKFLHGNYNKYTQRAILQVMNFHTTQRVKNAE